MTDAEIRERITQLRLEKNVSSRKMSLDLGLSEAYINRLENGAMLPSVGVLFEICDYFRITPEAFFAGKSNGKRPGAAALRAVDAFLALPPDKQKHVIDTINYLS